MALSFYDKNSQKSKQILEYKPYLELESLKAFEEGNYFEINVFILVLKNFSLFIIIKIIK